MEFDEQYQDALLKLIISFAIGAVIGAEREYRNKSAGLRTIILICLGSTVFSIISQLAHETEVGRIASNIVTGIGFLGAGAILREGFTVSGLTTASAIWVAAALGMAVGFGEIEIALTGAALVMIVLVGLNLLQRTFDNLHKIISLRVIFDAQKNGIVDVEEKMRELRIRYERQKENRSEGDVKYEYELAGNAKNLDSLIEYLIKQKEKVKAFEY